MGANSHRKKRPMVNKKTKVVHAKSILFVLHRVHLNSPSDQGLSSDKLDPIIRIAKANGFSTLFALRSPKKTSARLAYPVSRLHGWNGIAGLKLFFLHFRRLYDPRKSPWENRKIVTPAWLEASWEMALKKHDPGLVVGIGLSQIAIKVCKLRGIPTLEVQHGIIGPDYLQRSFPNMVPDYYFAWDKRTGQLAERLEIKSVVTGHPILADEASTQSQVNELAIKNSICFALSYRHIRGRLRWLIGPVWPSVGRELSAEINKYLEQGSNLVFRPHPAVSANKFASSLEFVLLKARWPKIPIYSPRKWSLKQLIELSDGMTTYESGASFEYAILGKTTFVINDERRAYMGTLYSDKKYQQMFVDNGLDLRAQVNELDTCGFRFKSEKIIRFFETTLSR